jgi:hypothetical protein
MPNLTAKEAAEGLLKPCPFCGGKADITEQDYDGDFTYCEVGCKASKESECNSMPIASGLNYQEAAKAWNTRTSDPQVQVLQLALAEAEGALTQLSLSTTANRGPLKEAYDKLDLYNTISRAALEIIAKVKG